MARNRTIHGVPVDLATIVRDIGALLLMEAGLMLLSVGIAFVFREWYTAAGFLVASGATALVGYGARRLFSEAPDPLMKHGMIIAAAGWFVVACFGALPFLLSAYVTPESVQAAYVPAGAEYSTSSIQYFTSPLHALFESMSGWTGSGLTMAAHEPSLPRTIQWWRSLIQWVGGVGVIVLTVSVLERPGSGSYALYRSETREEKIHPSIVSTVRTIWRVFLLYTALSVVAMVIAIRLSPYGSQLSTFEVAWQGLNHAMTGLATGGFSVTDNSIATYNSPLIEGVLLPIMTLGAIAFPIHYAMLKDRNPRRLFDDVQTRVLFGLFGLGVLALSVQNLSTLPVAEYGRAVGIPPWLGVSPAQFDAIRDATFQFISALTCTGFQSSPIGSWSAGGKLMISGAMVLGGAAGSTVGGIKLIRGYTVLRGIRYQFSRVFLPANAIVTTRIGDRRLSREQMEREFSEAAIVALLWVLLLGLSSLVLVNTVGVGFDYADALFEVASAQGNVGLSTGIVGPSMSPLAEGMFVLNMWIGRLEIIPVLVLTRALLYGLEP
ncbi:TrkH family potassium uptake protein [Haloferax larsenii]|jgi:trk system potassium uptake protein TrkH|uniref:Trk system potassium uptake protein TrkH n=1 Tax=Haloferax larsenii TaxID=302484 RepID=A0A1H7G2G1_HALLR|nr:TrkH family potassium uptake protein [Haloferax larsenii]SEK32369.1 trk system potassium uptake protein TrkH [Haloferax larsenii]